MALGEINSAAVNNSFPVNGSSDAVIFYVIGFSDSATPTLLFYPGTNLKVLESFTDSIALQVGVSLWDTRNDDLPEPYYSERNPQVVQDTEVSQVFTSILCLADDTFYSKRNYQTPLDTEISYSFTSIRNFQ